MKTLDKRIMRTILKAKAQYGAVVIIICIGLAALISISNTAESMAASLNEYYRQYQFAELFVEFSDVPLATVHDLAQWREMAAAEARIVVDVRADVGREQYPLVRLVSISADQRLNCLYVQAGSVPSAGGERGIALLNAFARANDLAVGDKIELIIRGEAFPVTVAALVDSPEYIYAIKDIKSMLPDNLNFGVGFINLSLLQEVMAMPGQANNAIFSLRPGVDEKTLKEKIRESFQNRGLRSIATREEQVSHALIDMEIQQLRRMSRAIPAMFLGIAALVIFMLISRLVQKDRTTIGILKATGFSNAEIMGHYLKLALLLGFAGAVTGTVAGYAMADFLTRLILDYFHLPLLEARLSDGFILLGMLSTMLFCSLTGLLAARGALGIAPAEAMRPISLPPGRKNLLEKWVPACWSRFTFSWKLVLRGIWRNWQRFALAAMGVALTYAIILFAAYASSIWDVVLETQFGRLETYDYTVSFAKPVSSRAITEMRSLAPITTVEPFRELPLQVVHGWREQTVLARALPKTTVFYHFEDEKGHSVSLPAHGLFLSRSLADSLGVGRGDTVELIPYAAGSGDQAYPVEVKAVVNQYLGLGMYMSLEQLERLTRQKETFSGALLASAVDIKSTFQNMANIESIQSSSDLEDAFSEYMGMIVVSVSFMVLLGGLLGFAILYNTISVSLAERERELSSLRVLGFSHKEIFQLITRENALALVAGLIIGAPLGKTMVVQMIGAITTGSGGEMFYFPTDIAAGAYLVSAALVTLFMMLTLAAIRRKVRKLDFLEALSSRIS